MSLPRNYVRKVVHQHNGYLGFTAHARRNMYTIAGARTTSFAAKQLANQIASLLEQLDVELRTRVDYDPYVDTFR